MNNKADFNRRDFIKTTAVLGASVLGALAFTPHAVAMDTVTEAPLAIALAQEGAFLRQHQHA